MANLKEVRIRITSVNSTQQITKAMKLVSATKLRRAQNAIIQMRPYAQKLNGILANLSDSVDIDSLKVYFNQRPIERVLLVVVAVVVELDQVVVVVSQTDWYLFVAEDKIKVQLALVLQHYLLNLQR